VKILVIGLTKTAGLDLKNFHNWKKAGEKRERSSHIPEAARHAPITQFTMPYWLKTCPSKTLRSRLEVVA
jgi:hypothetical protein